MAARQLTPGRVWKGGLGGVPVFMYHGLLRRGEPATDERATKYWLRADRFREQLRLILQSGRRIALLRELWDGRARPGEFRPPVGITFDDGRASDYEVAYPTLSEAGAGGDFFINTATVGTPGVLTWSRIAEMQRMGFSFQSHGHDHVSLLALSTRELEHQIDDSKRLLEDRIGAPVDFLAAPYGLLDGRVLEMALRVGYRAVCNSVSWPARPGASTVNRIAVYPGTSSSTFVDFLEGRPRPFIGRRGWSALAYLPKRFLLRVRPERLGVRVLETGP